MDIFYEGEMKNVLSWYFCYCHFNRRKILYGVLSGRSVEVESCRLIFELCWWECELNSISSVRTVEVSWAISFLLVTLGQVYDSNVRNLVLVDFTTARSVIWYCWVYDSDARNLVLSSLQQFYWGCRGRTGSWFSGSVVCVLLIVLTACFLGRICPDWTCFCIAITYDSMIMLNEAQLEVTEKKPNLKWLNQ